MGDFNPMQLLEINLIVLALALLPSKPFHPGPDGVLKLEKAAQPCPAASGMQRQASLSVPRTATGAGG